ncbi:hypothetical protein S245_029877 [Arachis hypogaea]
MRTRAEPCACCRRQRRETGVYEKRGREKWCGASVLCSTGRESGGSTVARRRGVPRWWNRGGEASKQEGVEMRWVVVRGGRRRGLGRRGSSMVGATVARLVREGSVVLGGARVWTGGR